MRGRSILSILLILCSAACVDRVFIDIGSAAVYSIVIDGHISDQPGPYKIEIYSGHDLEDKFARHPISVKQLVILDDQGTREVLSEIDKGIYQTNSSGIRGMIGRVYSLRIELFDGRIYESKSDSLMSPGKLDSLYYDFNSTGKVSDLGYKDYGFDIFFNSSAGFKNNYYFLWKFTGTFRADTHPEANTTQCFWADGRCQFVLPCSGYINIGGYTPFTAVYKKVRPCTCCTCWYNLTNDLPMLSDNQLLRFGRFEGIKAYRVPLNQWIFLHKIRVAVDQMSLSRQTYDFWKAIKNQRTSINSLFQPVTGKIPSNFVQISGPQIPIEGLFYATSISSKSFYITRDEIPNPDLIPNISQIGLFFGDDCVNLFPHATYTRPSYWKD